MCLFSYKLPTRSKKLYPQEQPKVFNNIKCGWCSECQQNEKSEWMYRTRYEAEYTINKGGYIVFDTLTYNEDNCPWSKKVLKRDYGIDIPESLNFRCFDYKDVTKFLKKLRKAISCKYGTFNNVKYFLSSEYGTKEYRTHRPHYHIIFFVSDCHINPLWFSKQIRKSWKLGITDGVDDKGELYFKSCRLFKSSNEGVINAVGYVSKYINKDSNYSKIIRQKVSEIEKYIDVQIDYRKDQYGYYLHGNYETKYRESYDGRLRRIAIRRSLNQFHKQSHHYGEYALKFIDMKKLMKTGKVTMPDSYVINRQLTIPMYYYRKLFQYYDKENEEWRFNELGRKFKSLSLNRSVDNLVKVYKKRLINAKNNPDYAENVKNILSLLGKRTLKDYAYFNVVYKDRLCPDNNIINGINNLSKIQYDYDSRSDICCYNLDWFDKINHSSDKMVSRQLFASITQNEFVRRRVINCNWHNKWLDFDKIDVEMQKINRCENQRIQALHEFMTEQRKKMKIFCTT